MHGRIKPHHRPPLPHPALEITLRLLLGLLSFPPHHCRTALDGKKIGETTPVPLAFGPPVSKPIYITTSPVHLLCPQLAVILPVALPLGSRLVLISSAKQRRRRRKPGGKMVNDGTKLLEILNVRVVGSGEKVLVLSHGFGTDQSAWQRVLPYFTRDYRVVLYDLVCAGSVNPDHFDFRRYTTLDAYVDDLLAILDALRVDCCAFVGHSVSAMIGILAAIRRPELFTKLVLLGASPRFLNDKDYHGGFEREEIEKVFEAMEANYEAWVLGFAPLAVGADVPAAVREFSRTLFNMRPDITLFVSRTVFNSDLRGVLGLVRTRCSIIQGVKDVSVPVSVAAYLKSHLGGRSTVEILQAEGHLPHLSAPSVLVPILRRALSRP